MRYFYDFVVGLLKIYCNQNKTARQLDVLVTEARNATGQPRSPRPALPPRHRKLSKQTQQNIVHRYQAGEKVTDIAKELSVHRDTVTEHLNRAGVPRRPRSMTTAQITQAIELYTQGLSLARIAKRLGFNASTINTRLREHGVVIRGPHDHIR